MKKEIDLAVKYPNTPSMTGAPNGEPDYPTLHIEGDKELGLPDAGTVTFRYTRTSETHRKEKDGSMSYSCVLRIEKLLATSGKKDERPSKRDTSTEDNLDRLMKEKEKAAGDEETSEEEGY